MNEQKVKFHTISEVCQIIKNKGFKDFHSHNLRYLEKALVDVFEVRRDEYLNRVYTTEDIVKIELVLRLKEQGLNYSAIKNMLYTNETQCVDVAVDESTEDIDTEIDSDEEESTETLDISIMTKNINAFTELMAAAVDRSIKENFIPELNEIKESLSELKQQNDMLKATLERKDEEHFRNIDEKLTKWREETFYRKEEPWFKKLFKGSK